MKHKRIKVKVYKTLFIDNVTGKRFIYLSSIKSNKEIVINDERLQYVELTYINNDVNYVGNINHLSNFINKVNITK